MLFFNFHSVHSTKEALIKQFKIMNKRNYYPKIIDENGIIYDFDWDEKLLEAGQVSEN